MSSADLTDAALGPGTERYNLVLRVVTNALQNVEDDGVGKQILLDDLLPSMNGINGETASRILTFIGQDKRAPFHLSDITIHK